MARIISIDIDKVMGKLKGELASIDKHVLGGGCTDFAEYRNKVGQRKGLMQAIETISFQTHNGDDEND